MTIGDKISKQRKMINLTQEQLADLLNVSRQSISKWESNVTYPETDKLVRLSEIFKVSLDYLLKDDIEEPEMMAEVKKEPGIYIPFRGFEYKSKKTLFGLPLIHVNIGLGKSAKGIIAIGLVSRGFISLGLLSLGFLSFGILSLGLLSLAVFSIGILSFGAISFGIIAFGAVAFGFVSVGAAAIGQFAIGAYANGYYFALGDYASGMIAIGDTSVVGDYTYSTPLSSLNIAEIKSILNENVPGIFALFKNIALMFL